MKIVSYVSLNNIHRLGCDGVEDGMKNGGWKTLKKKKKRTII